MLLNPCILRSLRSEFFCDVEAPALRTKDYALETSAFASTSRNSCRRTQTCCTSTGLPSSEKHLARHFPVRSQIRTTPDM